MIQFELTGREKAQPETFPAKITATFAVGLTMIGLSSCGTVVANAPTADLYPCSIPSSVPTASLKYAGNVYHAFGDSITYGFLLPVPQDAYPYLIANELAYTLVDRAIPGAVACDLPPAQLFAYGENPSAASNMLYSVMVGTNDTKYNVSGYINVFNQCDQATVSWLAVPAESKITTGSANATTSGPGAFDTTGGWNSWVTSAQGASISFHVSLSSARPVYIWPRIVDGDPGTYTYSVDGTVVGTGTTQTTPAIEAETSTTNSLSFIRIPPLPAGSHTVTLMLTSVTGTMQIVAAGVPPVRGSAMPSVLVSDIPYTLNSASTGCSGTSSTSILYNAQIQATVTTFYGDGLDVRYVPTRKYMFATPAEMVDSLHPNQLGQTELSQAFLAGIQ